MSGRGDEMNHHTFYVVASIITTLLLIVLPFISDEFFGQRIDVPHYDYAERHDFNIKAKIVYNSMAAEITYFICRCYAFTIWRRIYIRSGKYSTAPTVIRHEYEHVRQWHDLGVTAPLIWSRQVWKFGVKKAPLEVQARLQAGQRLR